MQLHDRLGFIVTIVAVVGALTAVAALFRRDWMPAVRVYLRLSVAVVLLQVVIGIILVASGQRPSQGIHWFYGAATLVSLPIAFAISTRVGAREEPLWVVGGAVATVLFAARAIGTG